jgi:hypothetical protein
MLRERWHASCKDSDMRMSKRQAARIVRSWAREVHPLRWTVDNMLCYGDGELARAIRILGSDDAWALCQSEA